MVKRQHSNAYKAKVKLAKIADSEYLQVVADNREQVLSALDSGIAAALEECGLTAEGYAKKKCPVDTGRLRASITHEVDGETALIGTNVEYAYFVEVGTSRMKAQPFLVPAATEHGSTYSSILKKHLGG